MLLVSLGLRVPFPDQADFLNRTKILIEESRKEPGVISYSFAIDILNPEIFRIFELYEERNALDLHMATEHFKTWRASSGQYERIERQILEACAS